MKARMVMVQDSIHLLLCTGEIKKLSLLEAKAFIMSFDSPSHYLAGRKWNKSVSMEDYGDKSNTIAYVDDHDNLVVPSSEKFNRLFAQLETQYLTTAQYAELHNVSVAWVKKLCLDNRIPGVLHVGKQYLIPENAPYPEDSRKGQRNIIKY